MMYSESQFHIKTVDLIKQLIGVLPPTAIEQAGNSILSVVHGYQDGPETKTTKYSIHICYAHLNFWLVMGDTGNFEMIRYYRFLNDTDTFRYDTLIIYYWYFKYFNVIKHILHLKLNTDL